MDAVIDALVAEAAREYRDAVLPALTGPGDAATRMRAVLAATFAAAEPHLPLLAGLFASPDSVFHVAAPLESATAASSVAIATDLAFTAPLARLLRDGLHDGTLRRVVDPDATAATLFNTAGWGYVHLRVAQRWSAEAAARNVLDLVLNGLVVDEPAILASDDE